MKKMVNNTHIEGLLYQHSLTLKTSGENSKNPGTQFITGSIDIATDDALTNIVSVHYTYVTAKYGKSGSDNPTYATLQNIINGTLGSVMKDGVDKAAKLRIDSAIGANEFYSTRTGTEELVSARRNEGGFIHSVQSIAADEKTRSTFICDYIILKATVIEEDTEKGRPEQMRLSGYTFDYKNALVPLNLTVLASGAMNYFNALEPSEKEPVFTKVWGSQVSRTTIVRTVEESAFGEPKVTETPYVNKDFVVTGASADTYLWDDESTITAQEFETAKSDRNVALAAIRQRQEEYNASKAQTQTPAFSSNGFDF